MTTDGIFHATVDGHHEANVFYAVTIFDKSDAGVLVWSGRLNPSALKKSADQIEAHDYMDHQTVSFESWEGAWGYLEAQPKFAPMVPQLRDMVSAQS